MTKILYGFSVFVFTSVWSSTEWPFLDAEQPRQPAHSLEESDCTQVGPPKGSRLERYLQGPQAHSDAKNLTPSKSQEERFLHFSKKERSQKENHLKGRIGRSMDHDQEWAVAKARCLFEGYASLGDFYVKRHLTDLAIEAYQIALCEGKMYASTKAIAGVQRALAKLLAASGR